MANSKQITVYSYGKINLSLDVLGVTNDGYHEVEMIMQAILLHDDVKIKWKPAPILKQDAFKRENDKDDAQTDANPAGSRFKIKLHTNLPYVPDDERNIAYKAALLMHERFGKGKSGKQDAAEETSRMSMQAETEKVSDADATHAGSKNRNVKEICGEVEINIKKRIPVAAGLAGGSGNGAAVIMGLAYLWELDLTLEELMELGAQLGSDVPFSVMSQAACNGMFGYKGEKMAATCALASGRGTALRPLKALKSDVLLCKPDLSVSTAEVYHGIDGCVIDEHPDNAELEKAIVRFNEAKSAAEKRVENKTASSSGDEIKSESGNAPETKSEGFTEIRPKETSKDRYDMLRKNMLNVLEKYTLHRYDKVRSTKDCIEKNTENGEIVLMSGSGPTIFALCDSREAAKDLAEKVKGKRRQTLVTRTLI